MTRTRARAPKGKRAYGWVPRNRGKNTTLIASMSLSRMGQAMTFEGATDKEVFESYVERVLAPALRPGQAIVLDNLGAQQASGYEISSRPGDEPTFLTGLLPGVLSHRGGLLED
ncbi:MAG: transposase [Rubrobacter sp.]|nr:transposase [Rubrobacter sp.]